MARLACGPWSEIVGCASGSVTPNESASGANVCGATRNDDANATGNGSDDDAIEQRSQC